MMPIQKGLNSIVFICKQKKIFSYLHTLLDNPLNHDFSIYLLITLLITPPRCFLTVSQEELLESIKLTRSSFFFCFFGIRLSEMYLK